jgi:hypothetical protein
VDDGRAVSWMDARMQDARIYESNSAKSTRGAICEKVIGSAVQCSIARRDDAVPAVVVRIVFNEDG